MYHVDDPSPVHTFEGHDGSVNALAVSGDHIISGSDDSTVKVWSFAENKLVHTFERHTNLVKVVAVTNDQRILSGDSQGEFWVWTLDGSTPAKTFVIHPDLEDEDRDDYDTLSLVALPDNEHALLAAESIFQIPHLTVGRPRQPHQHQQRHRREVLHAPHRRGVLPGAAARRHPLRPRLERFRWPRLR